MWFFEFLDISITKEIKIVKAAYAKKLPNFSPELNPEGFKKLREAYDLAIEFCRADQSTPNSEVLDQLANQLTGEEDQSTVQDSISDQFLSEWKNLYFDYRRRIQPDAWHGFLSTQHYYNIETGPIIREKTLAFMMNEYFMPQSIFEIIVEFFNIKQERDRLCEIFPNGFIDYIIDQSENIQSFIYDELLVIEDQAGNFLSEHSNGLHYLNTNEDAQLIESLNHLDSLLPGQTNAGILRARFLTKTEDYRGAEQIFETLMAKELINLDLSFFYGELLYKKELYDLALIQFQKCLIIKPLSVWSKYYEASCLGNLSRYEEAFAAMSSALSMGLAYEQGVVLNKEYALKVVEHKIEEMGKSTDKFSVEYHQELLNSAHILFNIQDLDKFELIFNQIDEQILNTGEYYYAKGLYTNIKKGPVEAEQFFKKAIELIPTEISYLFGLASCYHDTDNFIEAIKIYEKMIALGTEDLTILNNFAHALNQVQRHEEAIRLCDQVIHQYPRFEYAYKNRGIAYFQLGNFERGFKDSERALELNPTLSDAYETQIKALTEVEVYERIEEIYQKAVEYKANKERVMLCYALALEKQEKFSEAITIYDGLSAINHKSKECLEGLIYCHYALNNNKETAKYAYQGMSEYRTPYIFSQLLKSNYNLGKYTFVIEAIQKDKNDFPEMNEFLQQMLGHCCGKIKEYNQAITHFDIAITLNPKNKDYYINKANNMQALGQMKESIDVILKALAEKPEDHELLIHLSYAYIESDMNIEGAQVCRQAIELYPDSELAYRNLGWAQFNLKAYDQMLIAANRGFDACGETEGLFILKLRYYKTQKLEFEEKELAKRWAEVLPESTAAKKYINQLYNPTDKSTSSIKAEKGSKWPAIVAAITVAALAAILYFLRG